MDDDFEPRDLVAGQRVRHLAESKPAGDVDQHVLALQIEMRMHGCVGVEERLDPVGRDPAQQPGLGELVQRVVDGRKRQPQIGSHRLVIETFRGDVTVIAHEQHAGQRQTVTRGPQAGVAKQLRARRHGFVRELRGDTVCIGFRKGGEDVHRRCVSRLTRARRPGAPCHRIAEMAGWL